MRKANALVWALAAICAAAAIALVAMRPRMHAGLDDLVWKQSWFVLAAGVMLVLVLRRHPQAPLSSDAASDISKLAFAVCWGAAAAVWLTGPYAEGEAAAGGAVIMAVPIGALMGYLFHRLRRNYVPRGPDAPPLPMSALLLGLSVPALAIVLYAIFGLGFLIVASLLFVPCILVVLLVPRPRAVDPLASRSD